MPDPSQPPEPSSADAALRRRYPGIARELDDLRAAGDAPLTDADLLDGVAHYVHEPSPAPEWSKARSLQTRQPPAAHPIACGRRTSELEVTAQDAPDLLAALRGLLLFHADEPNGFCRELDEARATVARIEGRVASQQVPQPREPEAREPEPAFGPLSLRSAIVAFLIGGAGMVLTHLLMGRLGW